MKFKTILRIYFILVLVFLTVILRQALGQSTCAAPTQVGPVGGLVAPAYFGQVFNTNINYAATGMLPLPSCGTIYREAWFRFTITTNAKVVIAVKKNSSTTVPLDLAFQVLSGVCGSLSEIACVNNLPASMVLDTERVTLNLTPGTYYIREFKNTNSATVLSAKTMIGYCENDLCTSPTLIACGGNYQGFIGPEIVTSTTDNQTNCGSINTTSPVAPGLWFKYPGDNNVISLTSTDVNYCFRVYSGTCGNFNCVAGASQNVTFPTMTGTDYFVLLTLNNSVSSTVYSFNVSCCSPTGVSNSTISFPPTPANGSTGVDPCGVILSYAAPPFTGCNMATSYDIHFGTISPPPFLSNTTNLFYVVPTALADNTTYYYKVVSRNNFGTATGTTIYSFTTGTSANPNYCTYGAATSSTPYGANCVQLTPASTQYSAGCTWARVPISFSNPFDYECDVYLGNENGLGSDGITLTFQNSPLGISACGIDGAQKGAGGIANSLIVEIDTYDNDGAPNDDPAYDHIAVETDGYLVDDPSKPTTWPHLPQTPAFGPVQALPGGAIVDDGVSRLLRVTWDPVAMDLNVYFDGNLALTCHEDFVNTVFGGNPNVFWGFTAATGAATNEHYICPVNMLPLPVNLLNFSAECNNDHRLLHWQTASEINNHYFTIEKTVDGFNYNPLATIAAVGNSSGINEYQFEDEESSCGLAYYQLSQTDFDGKSTVLGTIQSDCNNISEKLSITSIRVKDDGVLEVGVSTKLEGEYLFSIFNEVGQIQFCSSIHLFAGMQIINIPFEKNGVFLLNIKSPYGQESRCFVK